MATYNKINSFVEDLINKIHDLFGTAGSGADTCNVVLSNVAPVATNTILSNITQIANGNGYATDGQSVQNVGTRATGTVTVTGTKVVWTSSGAGMAGFQYVVLYNTIPSSPLKPLICWWDYGTSLTLAVGETFTVKFNNGDPSGTILTLT